MLSVDDKTCGPENGDKKCTGTAWCSEFGWCGTTAEYNSENKRRDNSRFNGPDTQKALNAQCRKDRLYVDEFGLNCDVMVNHPRSQDDWKYWTDVTGKVAGQYCRKWCKPIYIQDTPKDTQGWGCPLTQTNNPSFNVPDSSHASDAVVKAVCDANPDCAGYYSNGRPYGSWYIASNKTPENCDVKFPQIYPTFFRKL